MDVYAAVIGTRKPDQNQILMATEVIRWLNVRNVIIRTGGAVGIDHLAMRLATRLEVYIPWPGYNKTLIPSHAKTYCAQDTSLYRDKWFASVYKYHPNPIALTNGARHLHARNYPIVDGVIMVNAFPDERGEGGTGQGIRIAKDLNIPLFEYRRGKTIVKHLE
jgi:hypothetical protein